VLGDSADSDVLYTVESAKGLTVRVTCFLKAGQVTRDDFSDFGSVGFCLMEEIVGPTNFVEMRSGYVKSLEGTGIVQVSLFVKPSSRAHVANELAKQAGKKELGRIINGVRVVGWIELHEDEALKKCGYDPADKGKCTPEEAAKAAEKAATAATAATRAAMETSNAAFSEKLSELAGANLGVEAAHTKLAEQYQEFQAEQLQQSGVHSAKMQELETVHAQSQADSTQRIASLKEENEKSKIALEELKLALAKSEEARVAAETIRIEAETKREQAADLAAARSAAEFDRMRQLLEQSHVTTQQSITQLSDTLFQRVNTVERHQLEIQELVGVTQTPLATTEKLGGKTGGRGKGKSPSKQSPRAAGASAS